MVGRLFTVIAAAITLSSIQADAQQTGSRWLPWQGCWRPVDSTAGIGESSRILCITASADANTANFATIEGGQVVQRSQLAVGSAMPLSEGGCTGSRTATWSRNAQRVYLKVEQNCDGGTSRSGSGMLSVVGEHEWLDVQTVTVGGQQSVRVVRYAALPNLSGIPEDIATTIRASNLASTSARIVASAPVASADIIEASNSVASATVEAWLVERRQQFNVNGESLKVLAKAGVSSAVTDLMVALAYPDVFSVKHSEEPTITQNERPQDTAVGGAYSYYDPFFYDPFYYDPFYGSSLNRYGYNRYGRRYYNNYAPVIIVVSTGGAVGEPTAAPSGQVVNGSGYTRSRPSTSRGTGSSNTGSTGSSAGGSSAGKGSTNTGSTGSTSSGGTSTGRTAKPKIPPPM